MDYNEELTYYTDEDINILEIEENNNDFLVQCALSSVYQMGVQVLLLISYNLVFNFTIRLFAFQYRNFYHLQSIIIGSLVLYFNYLDYKLWPFYPYVIFNYLLLYCIKNYWISGQNCANYVVITLSILILTYFEFNGGNFEFWLQIRGIMMIATMKIISLSSELYKNDCPSFISYLGYLCHPANCVFGPWITFKEYDQLKFNLQSINFAFFISIGKKFVLSMIFLVISNCLGLYLIPDDGYKWLVAYRKALSFRTSHYCVSYIAESLMTSAGFHNDYTITKPLDIEFPRSLVTVVISWNIPTHRFLKTYIYKDFIPYGKFPAVFLTFFISSLLHGLNLELSTVLLTLGLFSFLQLKIQDSLSKKFDACIRVKDCKKCKHKYNSKYFIVKLILVLFALLSIVHLAYIGILMDEVGSFESTNNLLLIFDKWRNLDFLSHWIFVVFMLVIEIL